MSDKMIDERLLVSKEIRNVEFQKRLKELLKTRGMSYRELAKKMNTNYNQVNSWLVRASSISSYHLYDMSIALGCSMDYLYSGRIIGTQVRDLARQRLYDFADFGSDEMVQQLVRFLDFAGDFLDAEAETVRLQAEETALAKTTELTESK